ncbi:MAG: hypothetical protein AAFR81_16405 [Chloroflexota bacterium]
MASNATYTEILTICIDRLHDGESIDRILQDYPTLASQLRPMLEAGNVTTRARFSTADISQAQEQVYARIEPTIDATFPPSNGMMPYWGWIIILLVGGGILAGITFFTTQPTSDQFAIGTATASPVAPATSVAPTETALPDTSSETLTVIEGRVTAINQNVITIFEEQITLPSDDPNLGILQIGDVIRVSYDSQNATQVSIEFVNILVLVDNTTGQVWRGDDCGNSPPAWANDNAQEWYGQCGSGGGNAPAGSVPNASDNDNDNDDDD